jgi:putative heme-binding domain-containing protein
MILSAAIKMLAWRKMKRPLVLATVTAIVCLASKPQNPPAAQYPTVPANQSEIGSHLFSASCAGCHGLDARGGEHAPNIATNPRIQNLTDTDIARIIRDGIPAGGMPAFRTSLKDDDIAAIVHHLRVLQGKQRPISIPGNAQNGRALFFGKAGCSECHIVNGSGGFLGPDLSGYAKTRSADEVRTAILDPNRNLGPRQGVVFALTRDGRKFIGLARNEDNFSLQLQSSDGSFYLFDKSDLARVDHQSRSMMPANYGTKLSGGELNDIISYLADSKPNANPQPLDDKN